MKEKILLDFGQNIKQLRTQKKLSQEELASIAGVHRTYVGMVERAEKNITLLNIQKFAKALNVSVSDLMQKL